MNDNNSLLSLNGKSPLYQLFGSLLIVLSTGLLLFAILYIAGTKIFDTDFRSLEIPGTDVSQKEISFLRYILISQQISLFIVPAIIILKKMNSGYNISFRNIKTPGLKEVFFVIVLGLCILPVNSFTGDLNSKMHLPSWLSGVENWMIEKEDYATRVEGILLAPYNFRTMLFNVFMIGVIPAIGEELIFRGVFQRILTGLFKSGHLAIWVTAFLFSAFHFQFFGFIPRFILGLVFGYLFFWSGTLWLPVISHFVNNAVSVILAYSAGNENINMLPADPWWKQAIGLIVPILIGLIILRYFRAESKKVAKTSLNDTLLENS
jgi:uncharacterized protein